MKVHINSGLNKKINSLHRVFNKIAPAFIFLIAAVLTAAVFAASCSNSPMDDNSMKVYLTIPRQDGSSAPSQNAKALLTNINNELVVTVTFSGGPGPTQKQEAKIGATVVFSIIPGNWTITVEGKDENGRLVYYASQPVQIMPDKNDPIKINSIAPKGTIYIETQSDLYNIREGLTYDYYLINDIKLSGSWTPIGSSSDPFTGTFNGNGKTISGLNINDPNDPSGTNQGLFGVVGSGGTVKNLTVQGSVTGYSMVGGVVGLLNNGTVSNCYVAGNITGTGNIGGVVGFNYGAVSNCYATGNITAGTGGNAGGVVGSNEGTVSNCYATGDVTSSSTYIGGVVGANNGSVQNCVALNGSISAGGGRVAADIGSGLTNNYARDDITPSGPTGDNTIDGADVSANGPSGYNSQSFWNGLGFTAANGWKWSGNRPTL